MAAADKGQPTEKLIRVHDEPGAVQFTYRRAAALSFSLGTGLAANGAAAADGLLAVVDERVQSVQPAVPPALEEELEDFISLDAPPAAAAAAVAAVQVRHWGHVHQKPAGILSSRLCIKVKPCLKCYLPCPCISSDQAQQGRWEAC